jgi:D-galactarolactone isomerase
MIWASNWPHNSATVDNHPDESRMLDLLEDWMPDEATRRKTLVENPARLYGF